MGDPRYQPGVLPFVHALREGTFHYDSLVELLVSILHSAPEGHVLSLGCGTCSIEARLAERGFRVRGIDLDPSALAVGRKVCAERSVEVELELGDAFSLALSEKFAAILVMYPEFPLEGLRAIAARHLASLREGGVFIATIFSSSVGGPSRAWFLDMLEVGKESVVCLSEYRRRDSWLRGKEVYLTCSRGGETQLLVDSTDLELETHPDESFAAAGPRWNLTGLEVERAIPLTQSPAGAPPPLCRETLVVWRKPCQ